jgi:hypothetical protein
MCQYNYEGVQYNYEGVQNPTQHLDATNTFGYIQSHFYFVKLLLCLHVYEGVRI